MFLHSLRFRPEVKQNNLFSVRFSYVFYTHHREPASHFCLGQRDSERFSSAAVIYEPLFSGSAGGNSERDWGQSPVHFWENGKHVPVRAKRVWALWNETRRRCRTKLLEAAVLAGVGVQLNPHRSDIHTRSSVCVVQMLCVKMHLHTLEETTMHSWGFAVEEHAILYYFENVFKEASRSSCDVSKMRHFELNVKGSFTLSVTRRTLE